MVVLLVMRGRVEINRGIRTHAIIALGSSMFMIISKYSFFNVSTADGARVEHKLLVELDFLVLA